MAKYFSMNTVPLGTKMKIKHNNKEGVLLKIFHYPTTFKIGFNDESWKVYKTHEIEIIEDVKEVK